MGLSLLAPCADRPNYCIGPTTSSWCGATPAASKRPPHSSCAHGATVRSSDPATRPRCSPRPMPLLPEAVTAYRFIQPCNPIRAKEVPAGDGWLHEVKFDGYRVQVHKVGSHVAIYSRNGQTLPTVFLPLRSCCTSWRLKQLCLTARWRPAMLMAVRILPGCTCDGPGQALSGSGHLTYLRSTDAIFVCSRW
jgi:hypothetical protein